MFRVKVLAFYTTNNTPADFCVPLVKGQLYACSGLGVKFKDLVFLSLILTLYWNNHFWPKLLDMIVARINHCSHGWLFYGHHRIKQGCHGSCHSVHPSILYSIAIFWCSAVVHSSCSLLHRSSSVSAVITELVEVLVLSRPEVWTLAPVTCLVTSATTAPCVLWWHRLGSFRISIFAWLLFAWWLPWLNFICGVTTVQLIVVASLWPPWLIMTPFTLQCFHPF